MRQILDTVVIGAGLAMMVVGSGILDAAKHPVIFAIGAGWTCFTVAAVLNSLKERK